MKILAGIIVLALCFSETWGTDRGSTFPAPPQAAPAEYLALSNRIATGKRPDAEAVALAYAWWKRGERQVLTAVWKKWPELVLELGTNSLPFFETNAPFTTAIHESLLALRNSAESNYVRLKKELLWLIQRKRYHEALSRIPEKLTTTDSDLIKLSLWLALRTKQDSRALDLARTLVTTKNDPSLDEMKLVFGLSLGLGEYTEAVYWGKRMQQSTPSLAGNVHWLNNMAFALVGWARHLSGTNASAARHQAADYINQALKQARSGPVLHTAALVHASLSNYQAAAQHIRLALALDTANTNYRALLLGLQKKLRRE